MKWVAREASKVLHLVYQVAVYVHTRWKIRTAYRLSFVLDMLDIFFGVAAYFMLGSWLTSYAGQYLAEYGENYASFLIIGMIANQYFRASYELFYLMVSSKYWTNELTLFLMSKRGSLAMILETLAVVYIDTTLYALLVFFFGFVVIGAPLAPRVDYLLLAVVMLLSVAAILSVSLVSASMFFLLDAKQGLEPVSWVVSMLTPFLAGVYYPLEVLPESLQPLAWCLPQSHGLAAIRKVALKGAGLSDIFDHVVFLSLFTLVVALVGTALYKYSLRRALKIGDLPHW